MSSSGAPRKIDGMKSMNVWVIAIDVMKIKTEVIGNNVAGIRIRKVVAMRLMWMPGMRPVKIPERMPRIKGIISMNIHVIVL